MNKSYHRLLTAILVLAFASGAMAEEQDGRDRVLEGLQQHLPDLDVSRNQLAPSVIEGLWVLSIGPEVVYVDETGEHLIQGDLIHLASRNNLTEAARSDARKAAIAGIEPDRKISFEADEETHRLTVFTDIDCGYCRQLHRDMDELNAAGISVDYLFYPRGGPGSEAWDKSNHVWCADDRNAALNHAKSGGTPDAASCENTPTEEHYQLGRQMQLTGTPALVTESGHLIRGYMPVDRLVTEIASQENRE